MRAVSLLYHDVVKKGESDASGFPGPHAGRYKLDCEEFEGHMAALHAAVAGRPRTVLEVWWALECRTMERRSRPTGT